jgi:uncharacterized protein YgiM (DUF1202 family)
MLLLQWLALFMQPANADIVDVADYSAKVTANALNVRSGPGSRYAIIGRKIKNQTVRVTHHNGSWRKIYWKDGSSAYVYGAYLRNGTSTTAPSVSRNINVSDYNAYVTGSTLNVRSGPRTTYGVIGTRYKNQRVRVTYHNGVWRRIVWLGGRSAYVHGAYLRKNTSNATPLSATTRDVDLTALQQLKQQDPRAAEQYLNCMVGKFTSKGGSLLKARTLFINGVKQGLKKIATSPMIAVNHLVCLVVAHDWAESPKSFSPQAEKCNPVSGLLTGCKELAGFYGTGEGEKIWDAFQFTDACDKECRLSCYFHGKNKRTYLAFVEDPQSVTLQCRISPPLSR